MASTTAWRQVPLCSRGMQRRHIAGLRFRDASLAPDGECAAKVAETVYGIAHGREVIEGIGQDELTKNRDRGKFYPFMSGKIRSTRLWASCW
jgi:hypothetical protein